MPSILNVKQQSGPNQNVGNRERARVVAVQLEDNRKTARVWVEAFAKSTCGDCNASDTCGQGVLSRWFERKARCYAVECDRDQAALLNVGRWVEVEIPEGVLSKASMLVFMLPLLCMLAGAALLNALYGHELGVALGGAFAFWLGLLLVKKLETSPLLGIQPPRLSEIS